MRTLTEADIGGILDHATRGVWLLSLLKLEDPAPRQAMVNFANAVLAKYGESCCTREHATPAPKVVTLTGPRVYRLVAHGGWQWFSPLSGTWIEESPRCVKPEDFEACAALLRETGMWINADWLTP